MKTPRTLLPLNAVARQLRVAVRWLSAEAGRIPSLRAGNQFLFDLTIVQSTLLARARKAVPLEGGPDRA